MISNGELYTWVILGVAAVVLLGIIFLTSDEDCHHSSKKDDYIHYPW